MRTFIFSVLLAAVLSGCATHGTYVGKDQLAGLQAGVTTEAEIVQALGKPYTVSESSDGSKTLIYAFVSYQPGSMKTNTTSVELGKDGRLVSYRRSDTQ